MGVEYRLANKKRRTLYELGKGGWYSALTERGVFSDPDLVRIAVEDALGEPVERVALDLIAFTKDTPEDQLEERGARWALATFFGPESSSMVDRSREAARICEAARKAGE